jgi:glucuronate isomerase
MQKEIIDEAGHFEPELKLSDDEEADEDEDAKNSLEERRTETFKKNQGLSNLTYGVDTTDSSIKTTAEDKHEYFRQIVLKLIETVVTSTNPQLTKSPDQKISKGFCCNIVKEKVEKTEETPKRNSLLTKLMKEVD